MHLLLQARRLLLKMDRAEARELAERIDNSWAEDRLVEAAKRRVEDLGDDCEFDEWSVASKTDDGAWVNAWIWVPKQEEEGEEGQETDQDECRSSEPTS
jgi:hypothetical protein